MIIDNDSKNNKYNKNKSLEEYKMKSKLFVGIIFSMMLLSILSINSFAADTTYVSTLFLNQDPDPVEPGNFVEVRWKVSKRGDDTINNLKYELGINYPFTLAGGSDAVVEIGDWFGASDSEEYYTLYYKLKVADDALQDTYKLKLSHKHDLLSEWATSEYEIRVDEKKTPKFVLGTLVSSPTKLVSDIDEAELNVELENIGDGEAENVKVELMMPKGFSPSYGYSDRDNLGTISAGSSKTAKFYMDIDQGLEGKEYQTNINITYKDSNDDDNEIKTLIMPISIPLKDKPSFEIISVKTSPEKIRQGDEVELRIKLKNKGGKEAESLSLRAFKENSQPFEFDEKTDYVGRLKPNEIGEAVLKFNVDNDATAKTYLLELETRAVDGSEVLIESHSADVEVLKTNKKGLIALASSPVGVVVMIGIIGVIGYLILQKKK